MKNQLGSVVNLNEINGIEVAEIVELQVTGKVENGSIEKIEVIEKEGISFKEDDDKNTSETKIYEVSENGTYHFRITASTGRSYIIEAKINNAAPIKKDLLTGFADLTDGGYKMIKVNGRTKEVDPLIAEVDDSQLYTIDVIYCDGDLILKNGSFTKNASGSQVAKTVDGLTLSGTTWTLGKATDVNKNLVVLRVNGDFTLESGFNLLPVKSGSAVPKGLFIYCTGNLTINGNVNMSAITCTAESQNVYLWKNNDGTFEYINKQGAPGGTNGSVGKGYGYTFTYTGDNGTTTSATAPWLVTAGGGSGNSTNRKGGSIVRDPRGKTELVGVEEIQVEAIL